MSHSPEPPKNYAGPSHDAGPASSISPLDLMPADDEESAAGRTARRGRTAQSTNVLKTLHQELEEARQRLRRLREIAKSNISTQGSIGAVVREIRESRKITLRELSKKAGVGFGMLYGLETQPEPNPTYNNLVRIAAGFNMPLSELIGRVESRQSRAPDNAILPA